MFHHQFWVISSKILNGTCNYFHILRIILKLYYCIRHSKDPNPVLSSITPSLVEGCDRRSISAGLSKREDGGTTGQRLVRAGTQEANRMLNEGLKPVDLFFSRMYSLEPVSFFA